MGNTPKKGTAAAKSAKPKPKSKPAVKAKGKPMVKPAAKASAKSAQKPKSTVKSVVPVKGAKKPSVKSSVKAVTKPVSKGGSVKKLVKLPTKSTGKPVMKGVKNPASKVAIVAPKAAVIKKKAVTSVSKLTRPEVKTSIKPIVPTISKSSIRKSDMSSMSAKAKKVQMNTPGSVIVPPDYLPRDKDEFMNPVMLEYFRLKLLRWKAELLREAENTVHDTLQGTELQKPDLVDRASEETDHALELRTRDRERKLISKIDEALLRIEDGSYGYCEETGEPISVGRLDARPIATLSIEAQERHERKERTQRDD